MDYEKKYNEALERAENIKSKILQSHLSTESCKAISEYIDEIIPELRESEDERIRKKCIELIKRVIPSGDSQSQESKEILDCIAYLEKQKEPTTEELYAEAGTTEKEYIANTMKMVRAMREKKQEQKPAEIDFEDWDTLGYIRDIVRKHVRRDEEFNVLDKWLTEHYVNQKPAWDKYQQELEATDRWQEGYEAGFNAASKPTEWSEEDERYVNGLIGLIEDMKVGISPKLRGVTADKCIAFLKSLRPSWKPSEEQMEALRYVAYKHGNSSLSPYSIANKTLASLYEQLKKL